VVFVSLSIVAAYQWRQAKIALIDAATQSSQANFKVNRNSLDALIYALEAGKGLQRVPWGSKDQELQSSVLSTLAQSVSWVREQNRWEGHQDAIQSVSFSPDGQMLATGSYDKTVKLWRRDGSLFKTLEGHTDQLRASILALIEKQLPLEVGMEHSGFGTATAIRYELFRLTMVMGL
jgi:WD40 repeat protein